MTSETPRSTVRLGRVLQTLLFVSVAALLWSTVLGLGLGFEQGSGWYVLLSANVIAVFRLIPIFLYREPAS